MYVCDSGKKRNAENTNKSRYQMKGSDLDPLLIGDTCKVCPCKEWILILYFMAAEKLLDSLLFPYGASQGWSGVCPI